MFSIYTNSIYMRAHTHPVMQTHALFHHRMSFFFRLGPYRSVEHVRKECAVEEATEISHRLHESADLRTREALPLPEVPHADRPGRDRAQSGIVERAGDHVVPEPAREVEARLGGTSRGRDGGDEHDRKRK